MLDNNAVLIILVHKQTKYWLKIMSGVEKQTIIPKFVYLVLDRPTEEEYNYIKNCCKSENVRNKYKIFNLQLDNIPEYIGRPNNLPNYDLFLSGYNRNFAINKAIEDGCDTFIFIDGDCIPEENLIKTHIDMSSIGIPTITCGKRKEKKYNWRDQRDVDKKMKALDLFGHENGFVIQNQDLLFSSSIIWTCNTSINLPAIKLIKKLNKRYYGREEVFNSDFLGTWGGEDSFLGIQAHVCKIFINVINDEQTGIRHIEHERPVNKYGDMAFAEYLKEQIELLNQMQLNNPLTMDFFKI